MKDVAAFAPYKWTIIARYLACGTTTLVGNATYATNISFAVSFIVIHVASVPSPVSNGVP